MPTYERCYAEVADLAHELLMEFATHEPTLNAGVKIDFIFAKADRDDAGEKTGPAITHHGCPALGLCRIINLRDRTMGRGDVEIMLDMDWWEKNDLPERRALLDHELHHISLRGGNEPVDDLGRPKIKLRKHDHEFGWFAAIAARHGNAAPERIQAKAMLDEAGQYYWDLDTLQNAVATYDRVEHFSARARLRQSNGFEMPGDDKRYEPIDSRPTTVTISGTGIAPITMTGEQLNQAAQTLKASAARAKAKAMKKAGVA